MSAERIFPNQTTGKNKIITVTGVSASGKDFLVDKALETDPSLKADVNFVNFGTELFNTFIESHPELSDIGRDALKNLPFSELEDLIQETVTRVLGMQPVVQLSHVLNRQKGIFTVNRQSEERMNVQGIVYVESDPKVIYDRRIGDFNDRKREIESVDDIDFHQKLAIAVVTALAAHLESGLIIVHNDVNNLMNNVDLLSTEFRALKPQ